MKTRSLYLALLALLAPAALAAQGGSGGGMNRMANMHPFAFEAPPTAEAFSKAIGLDAGQSGKYARLRDAYLHTNQATLDSLTTGRAKMRELMSAGNREEARPLMQAFRAQSQQLQQAAEGFDSQLDSVLTPGQKSKYETWKQQERERLMPMRRQRSGGNSGTR